VEPALVQTFTLSLGESHALHVALIGHDIDLESHTCECGEHSHNDQERAEHLLEVAFRSGEIYAIMQE
jgi:hypothetical protein